jgi:predicted membrane protein
MDNDNRDTVRGNSHKRIWMGLFLLAIGGALVLQQMGLPIPYWVFRWPMILIIIGLYIGFSRGFRDTSWIIFIVIGGIFLADEIDPDISIRRFTWPFIIMGIGLIFLLTPRRRRKWQWHWGEDWAKHTEERRKERAQEQGRPPNYSSEDYIDSTSVFGGVHKTIVSKNFKGGDILNFMGGAEINLSQADINGIAVLEITQVMGGTKLIVPPHWQVRNDISSVFAGVDDKRQQTAIVNPDKVLVLKGASVFGGIDIRNY